MLRWLDVPVMLVPDGCQFWMSFAPIGSVMPANTTGMVLVAAATACALGVVMATMTSGLSPANFLAIWVAVLGLPCADWKSTCRFLPSSKPSALSWSSTPWRMALSDGWSTMAVMAMRLVSVAAAVADAVSEAAGAGCFCAASGWQAASRPAAIRPIAVKRSVFMAFSLCVLWRG